MIFPGSQWKIKRKEFLTAMHATPERTLVDIMKNAAADLVEKLKEKADGRIFQCSPLMKRATAAVMSRMLIVLYDYSGFRTTAPYVNFPISWILYPKEVLRLSETPFIIDIIHIIRLVDGIHFKFKKKIKSECPKLP